MTDWLWLISFNDNCTFFFIFVVDSTAFVIIKRINKVFHIFKRLLFRVRKFKQQLNFQSTRWNRRWTIFSWYNYNNYKTIFCLYEILNMTRNFSQDISHRLPRVKKLIFHTDRTWINVLYDTKWWYNTSDNCFLISIFWFLFRRKNNWQKFLVGVNFSQVKLLVEEKYWSH